MLNCCVVDGMCGAAVWGGFIRTPQPETVSVGESATMACHSDETSAVNWQVRLFSRYHTSERICYNGDIVEDHKDKYSIYNGPDANKKRYDLVIHDVTADDAGEYSCIELAGVGDSASANLTVTIDGSGKNGFILLLLFNCANVSYMHTSV